jgi:hypothetical protein
MVGSPCVFNKLVAELRRSAEVITRLTIQTLPSDDNSGAVISVTHLVLMFHSHGCQPVPRFWRHACLGAISSAFAANWGGGGGGSSVPYIAESVVTITFTSQVRLRSM